MRWQKARAWSVSLGPSRKSHGTLVPVVVGSLASVRMGKLILFAICSAWCAIAPFAEVNSTTA
jgi:hypothetical protein